MKMEHVNIKSGEDRNVQIDRFDPINFHQTLFSEDSTTRLNTFFNVTTVNVVQAVKVTIKERKRQILQEKIEFS
jgi:hypothetical protein